ncbi:ribosome alternative rescue factor ArfA [Pantoea sp. LMR881]|uniref:alternative ribosome-rescue factor A n=1 Tax=Pantoea sp. LMR881 TaxID=3014336 RepID=UPI0022AF75AC|nr:ribosome alternative rescue factor ArfA [Pantoea sp. LMR881]MCZ4060040.1 ribosome alternative rescue factor ArfA [Pantoea sp. LMR881]
MNKYHHTKGQIRDNALAALLNDPLFRQRIEVNQKGKGSFKRKDKYVKNRGWETRDKISSYLWSSVLSDKKTAMMAV